MLPVIRSFAKGILYFVFFTSIFLLWSYWVDDPASITELIGDYAKGIFYCFVFVVGIIFSASLGEGSWSGLRSAFPDHFSGELATDAYATGTLTLDEDNFVSVNVAALPEGIVVIRPKKKLRPENTFLIAWERVEKVKVHQPKNLTSMKTRLRCELANKHLTAEIIVSRGNYPSFPMTLPWNTFFNAVLPPNVALEQDWQWPVPITRRSFTS